MYNRRPEKSTRIVLASIPRRDEPAAHFDALREAPHNARASVGRTSAQARGRSSGARRRAYPLSDGQTILREAPLVADHNSYHLGQMVALRRLLGSEPEE